MHRDPVPYDHELSKTLAALANPGLLLAATNHEGRSNAMTIGWGSVGLVWGLPVFIVLVRPSRFTYGLIEETGEFTVNVPTRDLGAPAICGSRSGREMDKFGELGIALRPDSMCAP